MNKYIFFQLCIACIAFTAQAQVTKNSQLPPVRTSDPFPRQAAVKPDLPLKGGDNVRHPKLLQTAAVPGGKTDTASILSSSVEGAQNKTMKNKAVNILQSPLPDKEAKKQQPLPTGAPKQ